MDKTKVDSVIHNTTEFDDIISDELIKPLNTPPLADKKLKQIHSRMGFFNKETKINAPNGNTPLHNILLNCSDVSKIYLFLAKTGEYSASAMSRIINDKGQLPIDLVHNMALDDNNKQDLYTTLLFFLVRNNSLKRFSDLIDSKEVIARYSFSPGSEIYRNLQIACTVVNESRRAIKKSLTHPDVNDWSIEERDILCNKTNKIRSTQDWIYNTVMVTNPVGILFDTVNTLNEKIAERPLKDSIGNCFELAFVALHFLRKQDKNLSAHPYHIKNGDHAFIIIGEGNNSVVCDAWTGEVYPAYEIHQRLGGYRRYKSSNSLLLNVVTSYNPKYHSIVPYSLQMSYAPLKLLVAAIVISVLIKVFGTLTDKIESNSTLCLV